MSQRSKASSKSEFPWKEILSFLGVVLVAYFGYLGIRSQNEIPIQATQTAEARLTQIASQPTNTIEPTVTENAPQCTGAFCFLNETINKEDIRKNKAEFTFTDSSLNISGTQIDARVWFDNNDLPNNVRITINFFPLDSNCLFSVGFGEGASFRPSYHTTIIQDSISFLRYRPSEFEERAKTYQTNQDLALIANASNQLRLERENGNVAIIINDVRLISVPQSQDEMQDINNLNRLFISANNNNQEPACSVTIEKVIVEELTNK